MARLSTSQKFALLWADARAIGGDVLIATCQGGVGLVVAADPDVGGYSYLEPTLARVVSEAYRDMLRRRQS